MLRVFSLNLGSLLEAGWDRRRHEVVAWIDKLDPDIVCLQEAWMSGAGACTAGWVADHATASYEWVFGGHPLAFGDRDPVEFGSAVLSRWPIEQNHLFRLPVAPDPEDDYLTAFPWELVHARTAGLDIFTCHLAAAPSHGRHRIEQVRAIDRLVRRVREDRDEFVGFPEPRRHMPAILTGDFNAEPASDEIRFLRGFTPLGGRTTFWQDAWSVAGDGGAGLTQDWRTHELAASLNVHRKRIDYVLVGDPFLRAGGGGRVLSAKVVANQALTGVQASDHCGLSVEIAWPDRPSN